MKKILFFCIFISFTIEGLGWGFYGHKRINYYAVFLLPPQMMLLYKPGIDFLSEHAIDPDKRRYAILAEAPRHYIDIDFYGAYPFAELPRKYEDAVARYGEETIIENGIVPWHIPVVLYRLTQAFREKNYSAIMKNSADIGHYIADAHVPLHASQNHNGQLTNQRGIHGFWESRIPELIAEKQFDLLIGNAEYLENPSTFIWEKVLESGHAADSVLKFEKQLSASFPADKKYSFEKRNNIVIRQYSTAYTLAYNKLLNGMVERRFRESIFAVASFWYTAWVNAGQPDLASLSSQTFSETDLTEFETLNQSWKSGKIKGRNHEEE